MRFTPSPAQEAWIADIRAFLADHVTDGLRAEIDEFGIEANGPHAREFRRLLSERGWQGLNWPPEYGGLGRTAVDEFLLISELEAHGIPSLVALPIAVLSLGPVILRHGTEANRRRWIPGIISGEVNMALGYSEPEAGTDLASLRTRADLDGDTWVINGQKIWNTAGHFANHQWLAVRTEPDAPKHRGISVLIVPNDAPGITIQPISTWGEYRTNQIFFDDVRVPADHLIGERGKGWRYITAALDYERTIMTGFIAAVRLRFDALVRYARDRSLTEAPGVAIRLAELDRDLELCRLMGLSVAASVDRGDVAAPEAAMLKVFGSELQSRAARFGTELLGPAGQLGRGDPDAPLDGALELLYRQAPVMRFAGGTNEIQRDIIARHGLGLPGERDGMDLELSDDQVTMVAAAREYLEKRYPPEVVRRTREEGYDRELWAELSGQGWLGMGFPEEHGGGGASLFDLGLFCEQAGRVLLPGPWAGALHAGFVIAELGTPDQVERELSTLLSGESLITVADSVPAGSPRTLAGRTLSGSKYLVPGAATADRFIVLAGTPGDGLGAFLVPAAAAGVRVAPHATIGRDGQGRVDFQDVALDDAELVGDTRDPERVTAALASVEEIMTALAAMEMVGGARRVLEMTVGHVTERRQFDRPIGTFQAVQHSCANMAIAVHGAELAALQAVWLVSEGLPAGRELAIAKSAANEAYVDGTLTAHQLHGGMGITSEHDLHLWSAHARATSLRLGTTTRQLDRIAAELRG